MPLNTHVDLSGRPSMISEEVEKACERPEGDYLVVGEHQHLILYFKDVIMTSLDSDQ